MTTTAPTFSVENSTVQVHVYLDVHDDGRVDAIAVTTELDAARVQHHGRRALCVAPHAADDLDLLESSVHVLLAVHVVVVERRTRLKVVAAVTQKRHHVLQKDKENEIGKVFHYNACRYFITVRTCSTPVCICSTSMCSCMSDNVNEVGKSGCSMYQYTSHNGFEQTFKICLNLGGNIYTSFCEWLMQVCLLLLS